MLDRFGFTPTESRVYVSLLKLGVTTGYAIANNLRLARANVYHALEGLVRRGAARKLGSSPSRYCAVAPDELVRSLEAEARRNLDQLQRQLAAIRAAPPSSEGGAAEPGAIATAAQLLELATEVAEREQMELLVITGPWASEVNTATDRARRRGVAVAALALGTPAPVGAVVREADQQDLLRRWGGLPVLVAGSGPSAVVGTITGQVSASGAAVEAPGVTAFLRHLVRRELASGGMLTA